MPSHYSSSLLQSLNASEYGLSDTEVLDRRATFGTNEIPEKKRSILLLFVKQCKDVMVYILLGAVVISLLAPYLQHGYVDRTEMIDAIVIFSIIVINAILGFFQEWRAENAIALLKKLSAPHGKVRRNGKTTIVKAAELVPGDVMLVEAGDRVSADARIILSSSLDVDESSLTGESVPVTKQVAETLSEGTDFSSGMIYAGTPITRGNGEAVIVATGLKTEIGKITSMVMSIETPETPLQLELKKIGKRIGVIILGLCALIFAVGIIKGIPAMDIFFIVVSLAVAAVPEGLPAIVTVCLAMGVVHMAKKHALIRRLDAIETLGSITVICADKTGTMTENRMTVENVWVLDPAEELLLAEAAASCNRAELPAIGDPTEIALLVHANKVGVARLPIDDEEVPFTSEAKYMVTLHVKNNTTVRYIKGAPEVIAGIVKDGSTSELLVRAQEYSASGQRVLAVAVGEKGKERTIGLIAMIDPPRKGVSQAISVARSAGIRTIMITGDHPATALSIAQKIGIETDGVCDGKQIEAMDEEQLKHALKKTSVFARVQPVHKVRILEALQSLGEIVSMSGDGVNDAPALKRANVGVGMGMNGTDIAREASAMVLTDDNYATLVEAIAEGRRIYDNIKKFVIFLMRSNVGEVLIIASAVLLGMPLPLLPLHILWINLVTDSFPALALAAEPAERSIMNRPPRAKHEGIFTGEWSLLVWAGVMNAILALGVFQLAMSSSGGDLALARTATMTATIVYQMFLALSSRTKDPIFTASFFSNPLLLLAIGASLLSQAILLLTPIGAYLEVVPLPVVLWEEILLGVVLAFSIFELLKWMQIKRLRMLSLKRA
jgi:Ca2+-transporting ATPase